MTEKSRRTAFPADFTPAILLLAILLFIGERAFVVLFPLGWIDSDDSIAGIMASDVALRRGHVPYPVPTESDGLLPGIPLYFYGQPYHGAFSALVAGLLSRPSVVPPGRLLLVTNLEAALWLVLFYRLLRNHLGRDLGAIAVLFAVMGPPYLLERSVRPAGNYAEVLCIATALLLFRRSPVTTGVLLGLGLWSNPLSLLAAPAACLSFRTPRQWVLLLVGFVLGAIPVWAECARGGWHPLLWLLGRSGPVLDAPPPMHLALGWLFRQHLPTVVGWKGWMGQPVAAGFPHGILLCGAYFCGVCALVGTIAKSSSSREGRYLCASLFGVLFLNLLLATTTRFRGVHGEPRYYVLLYLVLPVGLAILIRSLPRKLGWVVVVAVFMIHFRGHVARIASGWYSHERLTSQIERLERNGVTRVASDYWIAYRIAYGSRERILASPVLAEGGERYPLYRRHVETAGECVTYMAKRQSRLEKRIEAQLRPEDYWRLTDLYEAWIPLSDACRSLAPSPLLLPFSPGKSDRPRGP